MAFLIKRGPRPPHHVAPFHDIILCNKKKIAKLEAGATDERAWVWSNDTSAIAQRHGWLIERWNGLDIDYGHLVRNVGTMPDGTPTGFFHNLDEEPWNLLRFAIWWDDRPMPKSLLDLGVTYPSDEFSQQRILDTIADDGTYGFGRSVPTFWPATQPL